jgi:hypothetical protein
MVHSSNRKNKFIIQYIYTRAIVMDNPRTINREPIYLVNYKFIYRTLYSQYKDIGSIPVWTTKFFKLNSKSN